MKKTLVIGKICLLESRVHLVTRRHNIRFKCGYYQAEKNAMPSKRNSNLTARVVFFVLIDRCLVTKILAS